MLRAQSRSAYPPLTAALVRRESPFREPPERPVRIPRGSELAANARLFSIAWAGGFVFFMTFLG